MPSTRSLLAHLISLCSSINYNNTAASEGHTIAETLQEQRPCRPVTYHHLARLVLACALVHVRFQLPEGSPLHLHGKLREQQPSTKLAAYVTSEKFRHPPYSPTPILEIVMAPRPPHAQ
jgi:hypothetical protein